MTQIIARSSVSSGSAHVGNHVQFPLVRSTAQNPADPFTGADHDQVLYRNP